MAKIKVGEQRRRCSDLHVCDAPTVYRAIRDFRGPGIEGPLRSVFHRKHVDVAVQNKMLRSSVESRARHEIGHCWVARLNIVTYTFAIEQSPHMPHRNQRIARRVGRRSPDEAAYEGN